MSFPHSADIPYELMERSLLPTESAARFRRQVPIWRRGRHPLKDNCLLQVRASAASFAAVSPHLHACKVLAQNFMSFPRFTDIPCVLVDGSPPTYGVCRAFSAESADLATRSACSLRPSFASGRHFRGKCRSADAVGVPFAATHGRKLPSQFPCIKCRPGRHFVSFLRLPDIST